MGERPRKYSETSHLGELGVKCRDTAIGVHMLYMLILSHVSQNVGGARQGLWESGRWASIDSGTELQIAKDTEYAVQKPRSCVAKF